MENPYRAIFQAFADADIKYLVVGGVAVNLHGYSRFTGDLDILLALNENNLEKVTTIMRDLGYIERLPVELKSLAKEDQVRKWLREKGMTAYTFISDDFPQFSLNLLTSYSLRFEEFDEKKNIKQLWEITVPVISNDDLVGIKGSRPSERYRNLGIDCNYLRRCKNSTTEQKLNWLAAALEFVQELEKSAAKEGKVRKVR